MHKVRNIFRILLVTSLGSVMIFSQNNVTFGFGDMDMEAGTLEITMVNSIPVYSFNVFISGIVINDIYGGAAEDYNMNLNFDGDNGHHIHGFHMGMDWEPIPVGSHVLLNIDFLLNSDMVCIYTGFGESWGNGDYNFCGSLNENDCNYMMMCDWNEEMGECSFQNNGNGNFDSCEDLDQELCNDLIMCDWNESPGSCGIYSSDDGSDMDANFENCLSFGEDEDGSFFGEILNGYLGAYLDYADTSGISNIAYVTIESAPELDYGDEIGLLSEEGLINYGDCSDEIGQILVGSGIWNGGPVSIPAYGSMDFCEEGGIQLPGFTTGEPAIIYVWDADEMLLYQMDAELRDEIPWDSGNIVISDLIYDTVIAIGGDIDSDGELTVMDAVMLVSIIIGDLSIPGDLLLNGNLNSDDAIDILDIVILIDIIMMQ